MTKWKHGIFYVAMPLFSILLVLVVLEMGLRINEWLKPKKIPIMKVTNEPFVFQLNPDHPEINSHGMRDDEVTLLKPAGVFRILVLGDSLAYGVGVRKQEAFPTLLESLLQITFPNTEVLNASVMGYTTFNEFQYYLTRGRAFRPNLVILAFCMNDVVNPRLHWSFAGKAIGDVPRDAIPNIQYDLQHAIPVQLPMLRRQMRQEQSDSFLESSLLYRTVAKGMRSILSRGRKSRPACSALFKGKLPTLLTTEDSISIKVLLDDSSPEWIWLTSMFTQLNEAVMKDGGKLVVALFPLAYQLDVSYPYIPQKRLQAYCSRQGILCVDFLEEFRKWKKGDIFRFDKAEYCDIWHLTPFGHQVAAEVLGGYLTKNCLIKSTAPSSTTIDTSIPSTVK